jgi:hypothetical protein
MSPLPIRTRIKQTLAASALAFLIVGAATLPPDRQDRAPPVASWSDGVVGYGCAGVPGPMYAHEEDELPSPCDRVEALYPDE